MPYALPPTAEWQTYAGGTGSPGRHSYHAPISGGTLSAHGSPGTYMIDPVASPKGRHMGYHVLFCDAGGDLLSRGIQAGLYAVVSNLSSLPAARRAVKDHFFRTFATLNH